MSKDEDQEIIDQVDEMTRRQTQEREERRSKRLRGLGYATLSLIPLSAALAASTTTDYPGFSNVCAIEGFGMSVGIVALIVSTYCLVTKRFALSCAAASFLILGATLWSGVTPNTCVYSEPEPKEEPPPPPPEPKSTKTDREQNKRLKELGEHGKKLNRRLTKIENHLCRVGQGFCK